MYNGIGLNTPRGSGTNGYVVRNLSHLRPRDAQQDMYKFDQAGPKHREPDAGILEHERLRKIEIRCLELQLELEENNIPEEDIEREVSKLREELTASMTSAPAEILKPTDTHGMALAKKEELNKMARALGTSADYVEGDAFNREKQEEVRRQRAVEREEKERIREENRLKREEDKKRWEAERKERDRLRRRQEDQARKERESRMPPPPPPGRGRDDDSHRRRSPPRDYSPRRRDRSPPRRRSPSPYERRSYQSRRSRSPPRRPRRDSRSPPRRTARSPSPSRGSRSPSPHRRGRSPSPAPRDSPPRGRSNTRSPSPKRARSRSSESAMSVSGSERSQ
ncbi:Pre-mRNA-splicing factor [Ceratobasidium theobromae]|uniref:Pre-mRNA-splicing factor n=1 Tax=Ceratobasidium theobromae TaxID=1582974 RepID=A0A5N5QQH1_9AGAM|nr:Pre-mRNA-splicing factor [Ceratobasidium theobromae]